jgi:hypothetical protein
MVSVFLLEPPRFGLVTRPTKRCLALQFIGGATVATERVMEFCRANAFELRPPCSFHFRFGHRLSFMTLLNNITPPRQLRQLGDIRRDPPRVIAHWRFTPTR